MGISHMELIIITKNITMNKPIKHYYKKGNKYFYKKGRLRMCAEYFLDEYWVFWGDQIRDAKLPF